MTAFDVAAALPAIADLGRRCRAMAMLDAMIEPDWDSRFHYFDAHWSATEEMASMRDGSGNEYSIVFGPAGVFVRGFDHESPMSPYASDPPRLWPGLVDDVPPELAEHIKEPAFSGDDDILEATVCIWRRTDDPKWNVGRLSLPNDGSDPDGADELFKLLLHGTPAAYARFAANLFEFTANPDVVEHVYALRPLSPAVVAALNPELSIDDLDEDITEIGYPVER